RARALEGWTAISNEAFWRRRDHHCLENNRNNRAVRGRGIAGHAMTDLDRGDVAALLADPDAPFRNPAVPVLKDSRSSTVAEVTGSCGGRPEQAIYKRFCVTGWRSLVIGRLQRTPAMRSWLFGHGMRLRGLPTPRPLAVLQCRRHGLNREAYLLMEKVPD